MKNVLKYNSKNIQPYNFYLNGYKTPFQVTLIYESCNLQKNIAAFYAKLQTFRNSRKQT